MTNSPRLRVRARRRRAAGGRVSYLPTTFGRIFCDPRPAKPVVSGRFTPTQTGTKTSVRLPSTSLPPPPPEARADPPPTTEARWSNQFRPPPFCWLAAQQPDPAPGRPLSLARQHSTASMAPVVVETPIYWSGWLEKSKTGLGFWHRRFAVGRAARRFVPARRARGRSYQRAPRRWLQWHGRCQPLLSTSRSVRPRRRC